MADKQIFGLTNDTTPASTDRLVKQSALNADHDAVAISNLHVGMTAASATVASVVELATAAETTTGTDATRALTPAGLAGSVYGQAAHIGTSFPTENLYDGYQFHRTDIDAGTTCFYDLTNTQWLTCMEYPSRMPDRDGISATETQVLEIVRSDYSPYITRIAIKTFVATTNDGTHNWTFTIRGQSLAEDAQTTIYTFTTAADTADVWTRHDAAASTANPTNHETIDVLVTKNNAPGNASYNVRVLYRYIIT